MARLRMTAWIQQHANPLSLSISFFRQGCGQGKLPYLSISLSFARVRDRGRPLPARRRRPVRCFSLSLSLFLCARTRVRACACAYVLQTSAPHGTAFLPCPKVTLFDRPSHFLACQVQVPACVAPLGMTGAITGTESSWNKSCPWAPKTLGRRVSSSFTRTCVQQFQHRACLSMSKQVRTPLFSGQTAFWILVCMSAL